MFLLLITLSGCGNDSDNENDIAITFPSLCETGSTALVVDVIDGDTIDVSFNSGAIERVRYIGIDTPEVGQRCASEATSYNKTLVEEKQITLIQDVSDRDVYGRLLRYACIGDIFVNGQIVGNGYAEAVTYPPDIQYADYLESLESEATNFKMGCLWADSRNNSGISGGSSSNDDSGSTNESNGGSSSSDDSGSTSESNDESSSSDRCCRKCVKGKPCGDSCISRDKECHKPPGCACWG